jgi:HK97 family phage portal protein
VIVQSFGSLQALTEKSPTWQASSSGSLYGQHLSTYARIYASQPNVRTCVDFLARNTAQLGIHVFRRVSDTDRVRLPEHDLARWLERPTARTSTYRLVENLMGDLGIYFNAYWLKVPYTTPEGDDLIGLVRLPPEEMSVIGGLLPSAYRWTRGGKFLDFAPEQIVHFDGYNPLSSLVGLSPLDTLRGILAEEAAANEHRENYWRNAARHEGVIERPLAAPRWTPTQRDSWREQWQSKFATAAGAGMVAVLEDGMTYKATSFSARDSEYAAGRKLTREECAAAYHIPLPMVGILEHATFSNVKEQHKHLYQDCLGPWLEMIQQAIERQLLVESGDQRGVYVEFNINDKLKGSFEEQATSLHTLVGRPLMTANEGRARLNLPRDEDPSSDELAAQQGGPSALSNDPGDPIPAAADPTASANVALVLDAAVRRMRGKFARLTVAERPAAFLTARPRWQKDLAVDLAPFLNADEAQRIAATTADRTLAGLHLEAVNDW